MESDQQEGFASGHSVIENQTYKPHPSPRDARPRDFKPRYIAVASRTFRLMHAQLIELGCPQRPSLPLDQSNKFKLAHSYRESWFNHQTQQIYKRCKQEFNYQDPSANNLSLQEVIEGTSQFRLFKPAVYNQPGQGDSLTFQSRFECGNLAAASRIGKTNEYELIIQNDTNTRGYNSWFFFMLGNIKANKSYRLNLINFRKSKSLFQQGMSPVLLSLQSLRTKKQGWTNFPGKISYGNSLAIGQSVFYQLSLQIQFLQDQDCVYIASNIPYSYSRLTHFLRKRSDRFVCWSLSNNLVPYLAMGNAKQPAIVITARQHPGQTVSSYLAEQFILQLQSNSVQSQQLLSKYFFIIIPMVNVDGVIYGNSRCDISGSDLNRQWLKPSQSLHPVIFKIKQLISHFDIRLLLDLHGHSKKFNSFAYCCSSTIKHTTHKLPHLLSQDQKSFRWEQCTFGIHPQKVSTARAVVYNELCAEAITIQCSFMGTNQSQGLSHWNDLTIRNLAKSLIRSINSLDQQKLQLQIVQGPFNNEDSGSQSEPEVDAIDIKQLMARWKKPKKPQNKIRVKKKEQPKQRLIVPFKRSNPNTAQTSHKFQRSSAYESIPKTNREPQISKPKVIRIQPPNRSLQYDRQKERIKLREQERLKRMGQLSQARQAQQSKKLLNVVHPIHELPRQQPKGAFNPYLTNQLTQTDNLPMLCIYNQKKTEPSVQLRIDQAPKSMNLRTNRRSNQRTINYLRFKCGQRRARREVQNLAKFRDQSRMWLLNYSRFGNWFDSESN